jgi:hypothetical protein
VRNVFKVAEDRLFGVVSLRIVLSDWLLAVRS